LQRRAQAQVALVAVDRDIASLDDIVDADAALVPMRSRRLITVWDALEPPLQQRLLGAIVREVVVDEPSGKVRIDFVDAVLRTPESEEAACLSSCLSVECVFRSGMSLFPLFQRRAPK
jgi:hypothetical protein